MILSGIGIIDSAAAAALPPVEQLFTANGTWTCCPGATYIEVVAIGGGGGGGGGVVSIGGSNPPACAAAGGGGGGAGGVSVCTISSGFGTSQCVIIGAGGAGGAQGSGSTTCPGGNGGASCFGVLVCAGGGFGPAGYDGNAPVRRQGAGGVGNKGTSPSGGFVGCFSTGGLPSTAGGSAVGFPGGGGGGSGLPSGGFDARNGCLGGAGSSICSITLGAGGDAGRSVYGCWSTLGNVGTGKTSGQCYGAGGGGAGGGCNTGGGATPNYTGANGFQGVVKVTQYFTAPPVVPMMIQFNTRYYYTPTESGDQPLSTEYYYNPNI